MNIIIALVSLGILVLVHEGGHLFAAKLCKVKVLKFSIGFGPKLFSFYYKDTEYAISLIPLGGFVKMKGENPEETEITGESDEFNSKTWYQRAFIAFAGPFANLLFALFIFVLITLIGKTYYDQYPVIDYAEAHYNQTFHNNDRIVEVNNNKIVSWTDIFKYTIENKMNTFKIENDSTTRTSSVFIDSLGIFYQKMFPKTTTRIGEVSSGLPAWKAGLKTGDIIIKIDNDSVFTWYDIRDNIKNSTKEEIDLLILRNNQYLNIKVKPENSPLEENARIVGISQDLPLKITEKYNLMESLKIGSYTTMNFVALNYYGLYRLIKQPETIKSSIGGPVMIFSMSKESNEKGLSSSLSFIAAISILLMIMNLLPIPILDGGHIFFCLIEGIFKKPIPINFQRIAQQIGFMILMALMLYAFASDFSRLFTRNVSLKNNQKILDNQ